MRDKNLMEEMMQAEQLRQCRAESGEAFDALMALPEALRLPALLYYYQGYSQKETAKILGLNAEQVKMRMRQARDKMRRMLAEGGKGNEQ